MKKLSYMLFFVFVSAIALSGCRETKSADDDMEDGIEEVGNDIESGAEEVGNEVEDAVDD